MTFRLSCILLWEAILSAIYAYLFREESSHSSSRPFWELPAHSVYTASINVPWHSSSVPFLEIVSILRVLIWETPSHTLCRQFWKMSSHSMCMMLWDLKSRICWVVSGTGRGQEAVLTKDKILLVCLHVVHNYWWWYMFHLLRNA
jgi:hypothetical protein